MLCCVGLGEIDADADADGDAAGQCQLPPHP